MVSPNKPRHWPPEVPDILWGPFAAGMLMIVVGLFGFFTKQPLLFPSLGPTAFLQVEDPEVRMARFYNTVVGHLIGLSAGVLSVLLLRADRAPVALGAAYIAPVRILASALAIALTIAIGLLLRASHPPASATTLLVALGGFRLNTSTMLIVIAGVLLVGILGEGLRRIRLGKRRRYTDSTD